MSVLLEQFTETFTPEALQNCIHCSGGKYGRRSRRERTNQHRGPPAHTTVKVRSSQLKCEVRSLRTLVRATAKGSTLKARVHCVMEPGHWDFYERNQRHHARQTKHTVICVDCRELLGKKTSVAVRVGESKQAPHLLRV